MFRVDERECCAAGTTGSGVCGLYATNWGERARIVVAG